jgi:hypothetical protein
MLDWMRLHSRALRSVADAGSANGANWERLLQDLEAQKPISEEEYAAAASELRPSFVRFMNSKNIRIDGLHFIGSSMWTVHLLYSENAVVENLVIETYPGVHADGIVIDSSRFVKLENNYIDAGDDGLVIKSGKDRDGLRVNRPYGECDHHQLHGASCAVGAGDRQRDLGRRAQCRGQQHHGAGHGERHSHEEPPRPGRRGGRHSLRQLDDGECRPGDFHFGCGLPDGGRGARSRARER